MKKRARDVMGHVIYGAATALAYEGLEKVLD